MEVENATESSRAVVLEFCRFLDQPDLPAMFNLLHDDVTWTMVGDPENCFFGGVHSKQKVYEILNGVFGTFHQFSLMSCIASPKAKMSPSEERLTELTPMVVNTKCLSNAIQGKRR